MKQGSQLFSRTNATTLSEEMLINSNGADQDENIEHRGGPTPGNILKLKSKFKLVEGLVDV